MISGYPWKFMTEIQIISIGVFPEACGTGSH